MFLTLVTLTTAVAAPVPKEKAKVEPGETWKFPDLKSAGWTELKGGLKVWDVKEGEGEAVKAGGTITAHYTLWLTDGKEVDSSQAHGQPLSTELKNLVKGWQEGVPGMKPGGVRRLLVPPELGYGKNGAGGRIPPDSTLVFVIELVAEKK